MTLVSAIQRGEEENPSKCNNVNNTLPKVRNSKQASLSPESYHAFVHQVNFN